MAAAICALVARPPVPRPFSQAVVWRGQSFKLMRGGLLVPAGAAPVPFNSVETRQPAE